MNKIWIWIIQILYNFVPANKGFIDEARWRGKVAEKSSGRWYTKALHQLKMDEVQKEELLTIVKCTEHNR